jgi:hypothetical protein
MPRNTRTTPVAPEVTPPAVDFLFYFLFKSRDFLLFFVLFLFLINKYGVRVALRLAPGLVPRLTAEQRPALTVYPQPYLVLHRRSCDNGLVAFATRCCRLIVERRRGARQSAGGPARGRAGGGVISRMERGGARATGERSRGMRSRTS